MGVYLELTELGERCRESFELSKDISGPEETWYDPRAYDDFILNEVGFRQPIDKEHFLVEVQQLYRDTRPGKVRNSLDRLSKKGYITG